MRFDRLMAGPLAALLLAGTILVMPSFVPGYDPIRQTVSEIGEVGSPMQLPFTVSLFVVGLCLAVFAWALREEALRLGRSTAPAYLVAWMAMVSAGVGLFPYPYAMHNVFGTSELIGYQAPLVLAWSWRRDPGARGLVRLSWLFGALQWLSLFANLSVFDPQGALWTMERPFYGLVQRSLFLIWFVWAALVAYQLAQRKPSPA